MKKRFKQIISGLVLLTFSLQGIRVPPAFAQIPTPVSSLVTLSPSYNPAVLRGLKVDLQDPFHFDFVLDNGQSNLAGENLKIEGTKLIKYFLASLTLPENDLWVNLSPTEKDRIIPSEFGQTEMGRQLLSEDYLLKKLSASLLYPDSDSGKKFWDKVREITAQKLGTKDVHMDSLTRIWIMPQKAVVYQDKGTAFIGETHLKVLMEEDYRSLGSQQAAGIDAGAPSTAQLSSQVFRTQVLPIIEKEVNEGQNFASLRQVYYSLILASWYKRTLKQSLLSRIYVDQKKMAGVESDDNDAKQKIYDEYLETFKKGVYNLIREEEDAATGEMIPRKYFSGGVTLLNPQIEIQPLSRASSSLAKGPLVDLDTKARGTQARSSSSIAVNAAGRKITELQLNDWVGEDLLARFAQFNRGNPVKLVKVGTSGQGMAQDILNLRNSLNQNDPEEWVAVIVQGNFKRGNDQGDTPWFQNLYVDQVKNFTDSNLSGIVSHGGVNLNIFELGLSFGYYPSSQTLYFDKISFGKNPDVRGQGLMRETLAKIASNFKEYYGGRYILTFASSDATRNWINKNFEPLAASPGGNLNLISDMFFDLRLNPGEMASPRLMTGVIPLSDDVIFTKLESRFGREGIAEQLKAVYLRFKQTEILGEQTVLDGYGNTPQKNGNFVEAMKRIYFIPTFQDMLNRIVQGKLLDQETLREAFKADPSAWVSACYLIDKNSEKFNAGMAKLLQGGVTLEQLRKNFAKDSFKFVNSVLDHDYSAIQIREFLTYKQISEISSQYRNPNAPQSDGVTFPTRDLWRPRTQEEIASMVKQIFGQAGRGISVKPDFEGAEVMVMGPGYNAPEIFSFIQAYPGKIKALHIVEATDEALQTVDEKLRKFADASKLTLPKIYGYIGNVMELPEYLGNSMDVVYQNNMIDKKYFDQGQLKQIASEVRRVLKPGAFFITDGLQPDWVNSYFDAPGFSVGQIVGPKMTFGYVARNNSTSSSSAVAVNFQEGFAGDANIKNFLTAVAQRVAAKLTQGGEITGTAVIKNLESDAWKSRVFLLELADKKYVIKLAANSSYSENIERQWKVMKEIQAENPDPDISQPVMMGNSDDLNLPEGNIVAVDYIVTTYMEGDDLTNIIKKSGPWDESRAADLMLKLSQIVKRLHSRGIIVADLNPHNIRVNDGKPALYDFDLSVTPRLPYSTGEDPKSQTDIYQMGASLYLILKGENIASGTMRQMREQLEAVKNEKLRAIIAKALRLSYPYGSIDEVIADLEKVQSELGAPAASSAVSSSALKITIEEKLRNPDLQHFLSDTAQKLISQELNNGIPPGGDQVFIKSMDTRSKKSDLYLIKWGQKQYVLKIADHPLRNQYIERQWQVLQEIHRSGKDPDIAYPYFKGYPESTYFQGTWLESREFLVMDYIPTEDLAERVLTKGKLDQRQAVDFFLKLARIVSRLHAKGIIVADLTAGNIRMRQDGSPALFDFDLSLTKEHPEPFDGLAATVQTDIAKLGARLFFALQAQDPDVGGLQQADALKVIENEKIRGIIAKAVAQNGQGYKSVDEMIDDLVKVQNEIGLPSASSAVAAIPGQQTPEQLQIWKTMKDMKQFFKDTKGEFARGIFIGFDVDKASLSTSTQELANINSYIGQLNQMIVQGFSSYQGRFFGTQAAWKVAPITGAIEEGFIYIPENMPDDVLNGILKKIQTDLLAKTNKTVTFATIPGQDISTAAEKGDGFWSNRRVELYHQEVDRSESHLDVVETVLERLLRIGKGPKNSSVENYGNKIVPYSDWSGKLKQPVSASSAIMSFNPEIVKRLIPGEMSETLLKLNKGQEPQVYVLSGNKKGVSLDLDYARGRDRAEKKPEDEFVVMALQINPDRDQYAAEKTVKGIDYKIFAGRRGDVFRNVEALLKFNIRLNMENFEIIQSFTVSPEQDLIFLNSAVSGRDDVLREELKSYFPGFDIITVSPAVKTVRNEIDTEAGKYAVKLEILDPSKEANDEFSGISSADTELLNNVIVSLVNKVKAVGREAPKENEISVAFLDDTYLDRLFLVSWGSKKYVIKSAKTNYEGYLRNEREILTQLTDSQNPREDIVKPILYGDASSSNPPYIVTEYLPGQNLSDLIQPATLSRRPLAIPDVIKLGMGLTDAVGYAHGKGIVVRDLKDNNIRVVGGENEISPEGSGTSVLGNARVALFDFNTSVPANYDWDKDPNHLKLINIYGWTAEDRRVPLVDRKKPDVMYDIYAVGMTLLRSAVFTYDRADDVTKGDAATDQAAIQVMLEDLGKKNPELMKIVAKAIGPRENRYTNAADLRADLLNLQQAFPSKAASSGVNDVGLGTPSDVASSVGGIDLTEKNMNLDLRGQAGTFVLPVDPAQIQNIHIDGLVPVIQNMTPIPSLPVFLKLSEAQSAAPAELSMK